MKKFKRILPMILSFAMLLPMFAVMPTNTVEAARLSIPCNLLSFENASEYLGIYNTEYITGGISHSFGDAIGAYKFDSTEGALSLLKGTNNTNGGYYLFHLKPKADVLTNQTWVIVNYKTNATAKAELKITNNATGASIVLEDDVTASGGEYVYSEPVNLDANGIFERLAASGHCAMYTTFPKDTADDVYFYIKEIVFFTSKASAQNYVNTGVLPDDAGDVDPGEGGGNEGGTTELIPGQFNGGIYTYGTYWNGNEFSIGTSVYLPKDFSPEEEYGLLIYFHNAGGRREELIPYFSSGLGNVITKNVINRSGDKFIVFAPRCPFDPEQWVSQSWGKGVYNYDKTPISSAMDAVLNFIDEEIIAKYNIDMSRIYAAGDSMGGGGTWDIALRAPDLLAAILPTAGYCDPNQAANLRDDLAIWAAHSKQDRVVKVTGDRAMTATLWNLGRTNVRYTEYDTSDEATKAKFESSWNSSGYWEHYAWIPAYKDLEMVDWLLAQRKTEGSSALEKSVFTDIADSASYCKAVNYVTEEGLFYGISETEFDPASTMTRAQFATVLGRYANVDITKYTGVSFSDVDPVNGSWYAPYVEWAAQNGIIKGYTNGTFGVNDAITIEQACAIIARFLDYKEAPYDTQLTLDLYADITRMSSWAEKDMAWAVANSVYMGDLNSTITLNAHKNASRSLIATMFYNVTMIYGR